MTQHARLINSGDVAISNKKKRSILFYKILVTFFAILFVVSSGILGYFIYLYWAGQNSYDNLPQPTGTELKDLMVDWDALRKINPDIVAWIVVPNTQINYPIVHTDNNDTYLRKSFGGEVGNLVTYGCIFLDYKNSPTFTDEMNTVYGHNMNNGTMFSYISKLGNQEKFNSLKEFFVLTPAGNYRIKPFAIDYINSEEKVVTSKFITEKNRIDYIQDKIRRSIALRSSDLPDAAYMSHIFMFSTCDNSNTNYRYVLFGYVDESTIPGIIGTSQVLKSAQ